MLYTIAVILVVLWILGLVSSYTMGGFIHILLVIAIIVIVLRLISGRKPLYLPQTFKIFFVKINNKRRIK